MAGTGASVKIRHPIPAVPTGTKFLQSSHFSISQDDSWTPWTRLSTFKQDYTPYNNEEKPPSAHVPQPAQVLNGDERYFKNSHVASETLTEFQQKSRTDRATYDTNKLRKTNFKLDADTRDIVNVVSTQKDSYVPQPGSAHPAKPTLNTFTSHIPSGDREKAPAPTSDYKDKFRRHEEGRAELAKPAYETHTIQGDQRAHSYGTTHTSTFAGAWQEPTKALPAHRTSSIPTGDPDKGAVRMTEFRAAYQSDGTADLKPYDRHSHGNLQRTQFRLDDGHNTYNDYGTTMKASYVPSDVPVDKVNHGGKRNHSDIPPGDTDEWRQVQRGSTTSYAYHMLPPPPGFTNPIANGAERRTQSQVVLGDADLYKTYYQTTHNDMFQPYGNVSPHKKAGWQGKSVIPLDYYGNETTAPTQKTDYQPHNGAKQELNPAVLNNLKQSHIQAPLGNKRHFSTTQRDHFTPKDAALSREFDTRKLQISSVPLGTLPAL